MKLKDKQEKKFSYVETSDGIKITTNSVPRKGDGSFWEKYKFVYYLTIKNASALHTIKDLAAHTFLLLSECAEFRVLREEIGKIFKRQLAPVALVRELRLPCKEFGPVPAVQLRPVALVRELRLLRKQTRPLPSVQIFKIDFFGGVNLPSRWNFNDD